MNRLSAVALLVLTVGLPAVAADSAADPSRVLKPGQRPADDRVRPNKTLNDYFPFTPPASKPAWDRRRQELREQLLVALGLWPMPDRTPLDPVVHGAIDRGDYTVENVFFRSLPGHYVSGNLYRPKGKSGGKKLPGVLCPHGHWPDGRFVDAEKTAAAEIAKGAEKTVDGARSPLQARCAQLARMGCVVFHYDMVGYADSRKLTHREGFTDAQAELRLQSFIGLQTWNSIRALDFLAGLPDVDPGRLAVTGASGGGTQTFILCAIDDRPNAAFPAVMVSTAMQGGCVCENCSYLRLGTGNVELAGLFAPKPLGMSAANDWTVDLEKKGLPELKSLYRLLGAEDHVTGTCYPQFGHNYNQVSRELMYNWFNTHLKLGLPAPVAEKPFTMIPPKQLSVFDAKHPLPADAVDAAGVRRWMTDAAVKHLAAVGPKDRDSLARYRSVVGTALRVMVDGGLPAAGDVEAKVLADGQLDDVFCSRLVLGRKGRHEEIPALMLLDAGFTGAVTVWVHPDGKRGIFKDGKLVPAARRLLERGQAVLAPDVFGTGEFGNISPNVDPHYAGFTFGYNRPLVAQRVQDILTAVAAARARPGATSVRLVGVGSAGPWVLLASAAARPGVDRTAADANGFSFMKVGTTGDPMMLPGALKYGDLGGFVALIAPRPLLAADLPAEASDRVKQAYTAAAAPADALTLRAGTPGADELAAFAGR